ncbi:MAG: hypothetical protein EBR82_11610 [Caulobacteraceae bacterium]|nr:hypothetical protein [Caulobacteraceae bacterium]
MISFAATPQSKEAQQARAYTDPSAGAPPSRRSGSNAPYVDRDHWNKVFTDQTYFDSIAKQKGMAEGAKVSLHGDDYVYRQAMIGYLADTRNVPLDDMRSIFDAEKDSFAQKVLGKQTASAREMFEWQKSKFERDNEKQAAARQILNNVAQRAITDFATGGDTPFVESVAKDIDAAGDMFSDEEKSLLWQQAEENDIKLRATQMRFAPEAKFIFDALRQTTGEGAGFGAPDMREMATRFAKLPDNQRRAIYELAGSFAQLNQTDKGFWYQLAESLGRGASDIVERVPRNMKEQALRNDLRLLEGDQPVFAGTGVQGVAYSAFGTKALTPEEREQAADKVRGELGVFKVERELRDLAERVIDPIKTVTVLPEIVEEGLYGAARSLPYTAVAAVPYAGAPAVAAALYSSNYDRIMLEYPDIDPDKAALLAAISAPIEAGLERMKVNTIVGRLPFFGGLVKRFQHPNQRNITRIAIGGAGVLAEQNAQEILQNATFPFVQMIGAALDQDIPEYKLDLASMPRDLAVQFVALLPLSLMGIGALSYREISRGENYLKEKPTLMKVLSEEAADRVLGATTPEEARAIFREEYAKRTPEEVKAAAQRVVDEVLALREKSNPAALPRLEKQGADYVVLSPEGKELARSTDQTAAEQALVSARRETVQREMRDVHTGINEAVAFIQKVNEARQRGEDVAKIIREEAPRTLLDDYEANPTQENLDRLFETVRAFGQEINEPAELANFPVTGSNQGALREGIWRSIIRINEGADGTIVMREFAQDNLKRAIAEGRTTLDFVRQQLNDILPQIDSDRMERQLRTETDTDVIEAFSDIALAYFRGNIRDEQIPAGLRGFIRRLAIFTRDIFRRAYNLARLRAEGKLDRDFEALLAEAVGVDQQALVDRSREKTAQEVAPETANYSIGVSSQQDADYLAAVERGDMETAQRMVDEAAKAAGYDIGPVYHGSPEISITTFNTTSPPRRTGDSSDAQLGAFFTDDIPATRQFRSINEINPFTGELTQKPLGRLYSVFLKGTLARLNNSLVSELADLVGYPSEGYWDRDPWRNVSQITNHAGAESVRAALLGMGFNGAYVKTSVDSVTKSKSASGYKKITQYVVFNPTQIKSADPVTYDASGNIIPLSQRFDATTANINYSIVRSVDHFKNDTRFDKLVKDGRVFTGVDVNDFTDMHILLHSPDNAFAGTIQLKDGSDITGKGGVYYPALYADKNYFWASTEAMVMRTANHLNEIGAKNGGRILMGLVSAPVEKLFSSTSMATGVVKFLNALTTDSKAGLRKSDLNAMLVTASKVEVIVPSKTKESKKTFKLKLKASDSYATNLAKIDQLLEPSGSIFQVRKAFVESLAEQVSKHLNAKPESAKYVAGILADAENKHAKSAIKRGTLSKASFLQGLGNMLTEPFLRDFQEHGSGKIYAIVEVEGEVKGIATTEHESYPATIVPVNKKSKVKLHVLKEAVDWQDVVGKETGQYATPQERLNLLPTSGMSSTSLKVLGVKAGSSAAPINYSILARYEGMPSVVVEGGRPYSPIVRDLLQRRAAGEDIPRAVIDKAINDNFPAQLVEVPRSVAELPDRATIDDAIDKGQRDKRVDVSTIEAGEKVAIRQDVPAMTRKGVGVVTVKSKAGNSYEAAVRITEPEFILNEKKSLRIAIGEAKGPHIVINGKWAADQSMPDDLETWTQVGYNPDRHSFYYDRATMQQIVGGSEAYQIGNTVFVKDAQYGDGQISDISYSISTQSEIDRVGAALNRLDRDPLERVKIYEKAQEKFLRVMADNRDMLAAMEGGDLSQMRRTQILQALGELDGILSVLPPEIRSKIGGYTQLAKVDPMDVFKGDQKVSEVSGMQGAIISAWMREGLNIGEAQKQTELPDGYRAERNMEPARADRAIADVFIGRLDRINRELERFLRDEYNDAAVELFKRAKPQRSGAGEKPKGKLGADVHTLFDTLKEATEWSAEKAQAMADTELMRAESGELDPYEANHAMMTAHLLPLFADWQNADSTQRASAVAAGLDVLNRAYKGEQQRRLAERQKRGFDRTDLSDDAGVTASDDKARQDKLKSENSLPSEFESGMLNLVNFDQLLRYIFGDDSKVARELSDRQRKADNAKSDDIAAMSDEWAAFLSRLGGGEMQGQQLLFELSRMDEEIDGVSYSQNQLVAITMMWMQPKGRQHMEGFFDSDGNPSGNWHYNQDFVNKAEKLLRPEAKAIRQYLLDKYEAEYEAINRVYRKVYGMNLPKNQFYSPLVVESINAPEQAGVDPVTGAVFTAGANSPSALRSRGGAIAQPVFRDAVQTYFGHMLQMAHWKAYAQFNSEVSGILGHRDTRMVVKGKAGEQAATVMNNWMQYFRQGGNKDAANHLAINKWINRITGNFAAISLFGRVSTLALQVTQLGAASAKMPVGAYLSRFGKLMSGRLGWTTALESDYIQRRIKDMPPAVALAMQGLQAKRPSQIRNAARWLGQHLSGFDGFFTAGTYAIVYDYQLTQARQNGMGGQEAADYAREATERIVDEIAQPTRAGARSIFEINSTNPVARAVWAFSSEARKNMGLLMYSGAKGGTRNFGKALTYVLLLNGLVGIVIRNAFRDMRDEDDEEIFDEKNWGWKRLAAQFISDPIYGIPVVGETIETGVYAAFGVYKPSGPLFDVARGVPAATRMVTKYPMELLEGDAEFRDIVADVNRILGTAGLFNSTIAGAASISNLVKDAFEVGDNALTNDE